MNEPVRASFPVRGATPDQVFDALLDVRRFGGWAFGLKSARVLGRPVAPSGEVAVGRSLEFVLSAAGLTHRVESVVAAVEPPRLIRWRYTKGAVGEGGWTVEGAGDGAVLVTLHTDYEVKPAWLNGIAHRQFFRGVMEDLLRRSMRRLGERLEG